MKGKVFLVGAGPGDPGLLTVKALALIRRADLIIYDYLTNPEHLKDAKETSKRICVGKGFRHRAMSQEKINHWIVQAAKKGQCVVRLKGGDPYLFGRGGEEALFLVKKGIPFEVVPGVTSATACAAYAGIPLTHRDHTATVTFLTGHRAQDENLNSIHWRRLIEIGGTLVIYMGFYNLAIIAKRLVENGMSPDTQVCVVEWGTLPKQKSCEGTIQTIARLVTKQNLHAPCIIIIGDVVSFRKKLNWYEKLPLFGKKIVITRSQDKASALREKLSVLGAEVLEFPTIEIKKLTDFSQMDKAIRNLDQFDWLIFSSTYGVEAFFERLTQVHHKDARVLAGLRIAAVGPETARALSGKGVTADKIPARYQTQALIDEFRRKPLFIKKMRVLLVRAKIAPPALEVGLRKLGALVQRVDAYQTKIPRNAAKDFTHELAQGVDFVTFTSSSCVTHFVKMLGMRKVRQMSRVARWASIGPVTSDTLRTYGLKPACQAKVFNIDGLVNAILKECS